MLRLDKSDLVYGNPCQKPYYNIKSSTVSSDSETSVRQNRNLKSKDVFSMLSLFHSLCGLPYYGRSKSYLKYLTILCSVLFIIGFILIQIPGIITNFSFDSIKTKSIRLSESRSAEIVSFILFCNEFIKNIDNDLILLFKSKAIIQFHKNFNEISSSNKIVEALKSRKHSANLLRVWLIIIANIMFASLNLFLWYSLIENAVNNNGYSNEEQQNDCVLQLPNSVNLYLILIFKLIATLHSKAFESIIIYISLIINDYFNVFAVKTVHLFRQMETSFTPSQSRNFESLEDLRLAFIAIQKLIEQMNNFLYPGLFLTVSSNLVSVFGGVFIAIDLIGYKDPIEEFEIILIFNSIVSFISLFIICLVGNRIRISAQNSVKLLTTIRINHLNEVDYKSVSFQSPVCEVFELCTVFLANSSLAHPCVNVITYLGHFTSIFHLVTIIIMGITRLGLTLYIWFRIFYD